MAAFRCTEINLQTILSNFSGMRVNFPLSYLGLPLTLGRLKMVHLQTSLDRVRAKLAGWQGKLLSTGGRRELVRSVLSSMLIYLLTALKVPKGCNGLPRKNVSRTVGCNGRFLLCTCRCLIAPLGLTSPRFYRWNCSFSPPI